MPQEREHIHAVLRLTLIPGLGPIRIARLLERFGSPERALEASESELKRIRGVGAGLASTIVRERRAAEERVRRELELAQEHGVELVALSDPSYPALLRAIPNPPSILYVRGRLEPELDRYTVAFVGSRSCTHYGIDQTERLAGTLASSGLTIVSGGARGIDTSAHRAAIRHNGRTFAVLGCGLARCYPPENRELFDRIADSAGAVISELPMETNPSADNFPMRNRIISGLSLGVVIVEAAKGSGALITARCAAEDHGREVMALPGRVDSNASEGANDLLKRGGAALITDHADILDTLEAPAIHLHRGVHEHRYAASPDAQSLFSDDDDSDEAAAPSPSPAPTVVTLSRTQRDILEALDEPRTFDELVRLTGLDAPTLRAESTLLEVRRVIVRTGSTFAARRDTQTNNPRIKT